MSFTSAPALAEDSAGLARLRQLRIKLRYEWARQSPGGELVNSEDVQRGFVDLIRELEVFAEVEVAGDSESTSGPVDLSIQGLRTGGHFNGLPLVPFLSAGIIPIWGADAAGYRFVIGVPDRLPEAAQGLQIDAVHEGTCIVGWVGGLAAFLPGRGFLPAEDTGRYRRWLRAMLSQRAREIEALVQAVRNARSRSRRG